MIRFFFLFLFLMTSFAVQGQITTSDQVTVGGGTDIVNGPIVFQREFSRSQTLYYPDELQFRGEISEIRFFAQFSSPSISNSDEWVIKIGLTDLEEFGPGTPRIPDEELTLVFDGVVTVTGNGFNEITALLDTPFFYDGQSNLVIDVEETAPGLDDSGFNAFRGVEDFGNPPARTILTFIDAGRNVVLRENSYAKTKFIGELEQCYRPGFYTVENITTSSATVSFNEFDQFDTYRYNLTPGNVEIPDTFALTGDQLMLEDLLAAQLYRLNVKSDCEEIPSDWVSSLFTTRPLALQIGSEIDFESESRNYVLTKNSLAGISVTALPPSVGEGSGIALRGRPAGISGASWNNSGNLFNNNREYRSEAQVQVDLTDGIDPVLLFDLRQNIESYLRLLINGQPLDSVYTSVTVDDDFYRTVRVDLSDFNGQSIALTFQHVGRFSGAGRSTAFIDHIRIRENTCTSGINPDLGEDIQACGNETVTLDAGAGFESYAWSNGADTREITVTESGTYFVTVTTTTGCIQYDEVAVALGEFPSVSLGEDLVVCGNKGVQLDAGAGFKTYLWSNGETTQKITADQSGLYTVTVSNDNDCTASDEIEVTFADDPMPDLGEDLSLCDGETVVLDAGGGFATYQWSDGSESQTITVSASGSYSVTVTGDNGCSATDEIVISVIDNPVVDLGEDIEICQGETITLDAGAGFNSYLWSNGATAQSITVDEAKAYSVTVFAEGGCSATDEVIVRFKEQPVVDLGADSTACAGTSVLLNAGTGFSSYAWNIGSTSSAIVVTEAGNYSVTVTNGEGCIATDEVVIDFVENPATDLGEDRNITDQDFTVLDAGGGFAGYLWNTGATTQTIRVEASGNYSVTVVNEFGCSGTDEVTLTFGPPLSVRETKAIFSYHPNPVTDFLTLSNLTQSGDHSVILFSLDGKLRYRKAFQVTAEEFRMDLSFLSPGLYLMTVDGSSPVKVVKR